MTRRIGKSFVQLLTRRAVLIALGLGGEGGEDGCACACTGVVEERRGGKGGGNPCDGGCPLLGNDADPLEDAGRLDFEAADEDGIDPVLCWPELSLNGGGGTGLGASDELHRLLLELLPIPFPVSPILLFSDVVDACGGFRMKDARKRTVR